MLAAFCRRARKGPRWCFLEDRHPRTGFRAAVGPSLPDAAPQSLGGDRASRVGPRSPRAGTGRPLGTLRRGRAEGWLRGRRDRPAGAGRPGGGRAGCAGGAEPSRRRRRRQVRGPGPWDQGPWFPRQAAPRRRPGPFAPRPALHSPALPTQSPAACWWLLFFQSQKCPQKPRGAADRETEAGRSAQASSASQPGTPRPWWSPGLSRDK